MRLVSIKAVDLVPLASSSYQLDILGDFKLKDRQETIANVLVGLRERFGRDSSTYGVLLGEFKILKKRNLESVLSKGMER